MGPAAGRVLLITVAALAVLAVGLLVLTEQARWLRLAVVAALWAALAGAFAAARYRRDLLVHPDRADELRKVYELELEREVSARRAYELEVETATRRQVEQEVRNEVRGELDGLRAELQTLRQNLGVLLGGEVLVQRVALHAESTRLPPLPDQARAARCSTERAERAERALSRGRGYEPEAGGNPTDVLPRYRQSASGPEPAAVRGYRQPPAPPETNGAGGRRRRPDNVGSPPAADLTAIRRHDDHDDGRPASSGTGRRRAPETQGGAVGDLRASYGGASEHYGGIEPRRRHRRED